MIDKAPKRSEGELRLLALAHLQRSGPMTASNLGALLWGACTRQGAANRKPQAFARPAGKLLRGLAADGLVSCRSDGHHWMWSITVATDVQAALGAAVMRTAREQLGPVFEHFKLGRVGTIYRTYASRHQRSEGAWSWWSQPPGNIGSQWSVREVVRAFKEKRLDIFQDRCGDIHLLVDK